MQLQVAALIIALACFSRSPGVSAQRSFRQTGVQYCTTPERYYGQCVTLSFCPQIANVFTTTNQRQAQQYVIQAQRACGTRSVNGDPVVCCTNPRTAPPTTARPVRQTQRPAPVTQRQPNPFFPTQAPSNNNPFLNPNTRAPPVVRPNPPTSAPIPVVVTPVPTAAPTPAPTPPPTSAALTEKAAGSCQSPDARPGSCIPLIQCPELAQRLQNNPDDDTFRQYLLLSNSFCGGGGSTICCPTSGEPQPVDVPTIRNSNEIPRRLPTVAEGCGYTNNAFRKIVGGEVSKRGAWPWITLIGYDDELSASPFKCGGALVTARHVITAAHCIRRDLTFVRLGEHDLSTETEAQTQDIKVVRTERHPDYNTRNGHSDIAVLYLERNVEFNEYIAPVCMPTTPELRSKSYVKHSPFVVGWGKTMEGGESATVLQELQIPIYDNSVCRDRYQRQNRLFSENQFDSAVICAGVLSGGKDTCQGDSGGPLMAPEHPSGDGVRYFLIGVVSYGIGCARPEIPGVYASTQHFMDWIIEKIADTP